MTVYDKEGILLRRGLRRWREKRLGEIEQKLAELRHNGQQLAERLKETDTATARLTEERARLKRANDIGLAHDFNRHVAAEKNGGEQFLSLSPFGWLTYFLGRHSAHRTNFTNDRLELLSHVSCLDCGQAETWSHCERRILRSGQPQ